MKQRVGIARALSMQPKVLLMDEPFGALDALTRAHLQDELMKIVAETKSTVVMVTHDPETAASVERYQALVSLLKQHLHELLVYRIGEIELDVYIMGKTAIGAWAGLATKAVET